MKTVSSKLWIYMASINWCLRCGKITDMIRVRTGLPGISAKRCISCNSGIQTNYIDDPSDIEIEDAMIVVPDNFCPLCNGETTFRQSLIKDTLHHSDNLYIGKICERCNSVIVDFGGEQAFFSNQNQRRSDIIEVG